MPRALISVSDKRGVSEFAKNLVDLGWELLSTGGTAKTLIDAGLKVTLVENVTGFPEILNGRVKTLHPAIHSAILAKRDDPAHMATLEEHGFEPIDLVVVNLYPFRETISRPGVTFGDAVEQIDIGGPSLLRAAAKNHAGVLAVVDPRDYNRLLDALRSNKTDMSLRRELAAKVFFHTSAYDAAIAEYVHPGGKELPPVIGVSLEQIQSLRYGENPQQRGAVYATDELRGAKDLVQLNGKELSFNNLMDVDAATMAISPWPDRIACAIIKHTTPCGIALGNSAAEAFRKALATDPVSAFGSIVALNTLVDDEVACAIAELFVEVVVAPRFNESALEILRRKKNLRVLELPLPDASPALDFKRIRGGMLVQDRFRYDADETGWRVAGSREPADGEWRDLRFAWAAVASVKSNAVLLARGEAAIGIGAGQMSRVDSSFIAAHKATQAGHDPKGAVLASDAFFPFADGVEEAARAGVTAIIQPGGSIRDTEVIAAADAHDIAMVMTGRRQFRH